MKLRKSQQHLMAGCLVASMALLIAISPASGADKPKAPSPKAPSPAKSSGGSSGPRSSGSGVTAHSAATASHGPTTASHGPTTTGHAGASTTAHPVTTTVSHPSATSTTTGHTASTTGTTGHPGTVTGTHAAGAGGAGTGTHSGTAAGGGEGGKTFGKTGSTPAGGSAAGGKTFGRTATTPSARGSAPVARNNTVVATRSGTVVKRQDGRVATVHDTRRGMDVHRNLSGNRRVVVERGDHSRVVVERGGHGYVQRPYSWHGHEYARRSYYYHGRYYNNYYGRYYYRGAYINPYYPSYYWGPAYYGWVYNPWVNPIRFAWGWNANPWYGYYGSWFTPYPVYASASLWLTDYIISNSLAAAYQARLDAQAQNAQMEGAAPLSPEVKQLIADEVRSQVALENAEAKTAGGGAEPDAASSSIQRMLDDGRPHVFVAGHDLDVVDAGGNECALSEGDAVQLAGRTAPDATAVNLAVLATKGGKECPKGDTVSVQLADLQDMQNHMRETIDQGMQELQKKQGTGGLPPAPAAAKAAPVESAMAASAPPPPPEKEVASELNQQAQEADRVEKQATAEAANGPSDAAAPAPTANITEGQSIDDVTAALGQPTKIVNLGAKKIYVYKDLKITFKDGKVSDVQ